jgi:hypothetical protein
MTSTMMICCHIALLVLLLCLITQSFHITDPGTRTNARDLKLLAGRDDQATAAYLQRMVSSTYHDKPLTMLC